MKGTSPLLIFAAYLSTLLIFESVVASLLMDAGLKPYRAEKLCFLLAAFFLLATHKLHTDPRQAKIDFSAPTPKNIRHAVFLALLITITGIALIGVQAFLTALISEPKAAELWNFTGKPGVLGIHEKYFGFRSGPLNLALFASTQFIAAPLIEEIYFKGLILDKLLVRHSHWMGIIATSLLFSLAHDSRTFLSVFAFSLFTCIYYQRCRNIWILVLIHGIGNVFDWIYSGLGGISFIEAKQADELGKFLTWSAEIPIAVISCFICYLLVIRPSQPTPPAPSPAPSSPDQHPS